MSATLTVAPEVELEVAQAAVWYQSQRAGLGEEFLSAIDGAIERIAAAPSAGSPWHEYRKGRVRRFPYVVFYRVIDVDEIEISAVVHMSRRPGYWLDR